MSGKKEDGGIIYITHGGELLFWLSIVLLIVLIFTASFQIHKKRGIYYDIYMPDADGLIVGSPVRMMGIETGHVVKIKPVGEEVFIRFIITDKSAVIPAGTTVTVESGGMAGSRSLELYLPNEPADEMTSLLTVSPPKRLHEALGLLDDMFDELTSIMHTSSAFGQKLKFLDFKKGNSRDLEKFLNDADKYADSSCAKAADISEKLQLIIERIKKHDEQ